MATSITLLAKGSSIAFSPATVMGLNVLGQASYVQAIQDWQYPLPYTQKALFTDVLAIQVHTQKVVSGVWKPKLYILDHNKIEIAGIDLNVSPYLKGVQLIAGNQYSSPVVAPTNMLTTMWAFSFDSFPSQIPEGGIYYLRLDNYYSMTDFVSAYSEPILLSDSHPGTQLYEFMYDTNRGEQSNVVVSGWFDDYLTGNSITYSPVFSLRCESLISGFVPKAVNVGYLQQSYNQRQVKTQQARTWTLKVGEIALGIPYYMLEKITEAVLSDNWQLTNFGDTHSYSYIVFNPQSQPSLSDLWKIKDAEVVPLVYASCTVMERDPSQQAMVTPIRPPFGRIFDDTFDSIFA